MAMPQTRPWTREDLDRLPDDGNRYELLHGELLVTPAPSEVHQAIVYWLNDLLTPFVLAQGLGQVQFPRGVMMAGGSQLEPDLMVRPRARLTAWEDAPVPILVIEVLSKGTRQRDLYDKPAFYMAQGVHEYWAVDVDARAVICMRADGERRASESLAWSPRETAATLEVDVVAMFAVVLP